MRLTQKRPARVFHKVPLLVVDQRRVHHAHFVIDRRIVPVATENVVLHPQLRCTERFNGAGGSDCNNVSLVVARIYFSSSSTPPPLRSLTLQGALARVAAQIAHVVVSQMVR